MADRYDVVIAGAGIAGLSLAALLCARGDLSVLLVDKDDVPGGRFRVERRDGYVLDWGVHACLLGSRGAIASVLSKCPDPPKILPAGAAIYDGERVLSFLGESLVSLARQEAFGLRDLVRLGLDSLRAHSGSWYGRSVDMWARDGAASPELERVVRSLSVGLLPTDRFDRASIGEVLAFLRQAMRRFSALGYPQGGWSTVLDSLTGAVERPGNCDYVLGARLERVFAYAGRVERVLVNGREVDAGAVVCAFPPQRLAEKGFVEPGLPLGYAARLAALEEGGGVFVDIGLERPVTDDPRLIISPDPPALVWAVSNIAPEVAPRGRQLLQLFSPIPGSELDDGALVAARVAALTGLAQELFGGDLPEAWRRVKSSLIVSVVPYTDQSRRSRPSVEVPGVEGLYLIGDGVSVPGLGGELAARSALIAARMLRRRAGDRARPARQRLMPEWGYS